LANIKKHEINYELVKKLAAEGLSQSQIARICNIPISTFETYVFKDQELQLALKEGKALPNLVVEASLFRNAIGFPTVKETYKRVPHKKVQPNGEVIVEHEMVLDRQTRELTAGQTQAQQIWLQANWPEKYRQRIDINHSFANMTKLAQGSE
jgi:hypothetical protein